MPENPQQAIWTNVDDYITGTLPHNDAALTAAIAANTAAGLPSIDVAPNQGKFLHLLARVMGARRILEIGTLGGYSSIWMARALPAEGQLITLEFEAKHAAVALSNLTRAGLSHLVEIRIGPALDSLAHLAETSAAPFDMIFIDADKQNNAAYLDWAIQLSRPGTLIICDNVVREGHLADHNSDDTAVTATRQMFSDAGANPRLCATALQTVGSKGHDGFFLAVVLPK